MEGTATALPAARRLIWVKNALLVEFMILNIY
jgi:hypothetical protein